MQTRTKTKYSENFLNNQNYILGKTEKKKLLSKFFIERILYRIFRLNISPLTSFITIIFLFLFIIILHLFFPSILIGIINFILNFLLFAAVISGIGFFFILINLLFDLSNKPASFINYIFTLSNNIKNNNERFVTIIIYIISFLVWLVTYLFVEMFTKMYRFIKFEPNSILLEKFNFKQNNIAENKYYNIESK